MFDIRYGVVDPQELEYKLCGVHTFAYIDANKAHMEKHGIINPVFVISEVGRPAYVHSGVTRTHCARLWGFTLRAIVYDPAGRFKQLPLISPADVASKFPSGCIYNGFPKGIPDVAAMPVDLK